MIRRETNTRDGNTPYVFSKCGTTPIQIHRDRDPAVRDECSATIAPPQKAKTRKKQNICQYELRNGYAPFALNCGAGCTLAQQQAMTFVITTTSNSNCGIATSRPSASQNMQHSANMAIAKATKRNNQATWVSLTVDDVAASKRHDTASILVNQPTRDK